MKSGQTVASRHILNAIALVSVVVLIWLFISDVQEFSLPERLVINLYFYFSILSVYAAILLFILVRLDRKESAEPSSIWNYVRLILGGLWVLDGVLQLQPEMAFGFVSFILLPAAGNLPGWMAPAVSPVISLWVHNSAFLDALSAIFQVFLGSGFLMLKSSRFVRPIAIISFSWAMAIWVIGEGMGGVLEQGVSLLSGFPGSAMVYAVLSVLLIFVASDRAGIRYLRALLFVVFLMSAIIQVLPSNGFWSPGSISFIPGTYVFFRQPIFLADILVSAGQLFSVGWFPWNAVIATVLFSTAILWILKPRIASVQSVILLSLIWLIGQDFGIFGGYGTDPNTAIVLLLVSLAVFKGTSCKGNSDYSYEVGTRLRSLN